jgi:hypothetical protein
VAITVKFLTKHHGGKNSPAWLRLSPGGSGVWGDCHFDFSPRLERYDWLVVYDDLPASHPLERLACDPSHTILVTNEPPSIKLYEPAYTAQFAHVITSQPAADLPHPGRIEHPSTLLWYYGLHLGAGRGYDDLRGPPPVKTADLSTVCSSKRQGHTLHRLRFDFTHALKKRLPGLEIFGHGVRPITDKAEALEPYRYHVVFENHHAPVHWTEKLADAFLAGCLPIYHGCPDAARWFPAESFVRFDPYDVEGSARLIEGLIAEDAHTRRLPAILEARRRVLEEHNLLAVLARAIGHHPGTSPGAGPPAGELLGRRALRRRHPLRSLPFLVSRSLRRLLRRDAAQK